MSRVARLTVFAAGAVVLAGLWLVAVSGLSPVGHYPGPYGDILNAVALFERHATDVVSAINFDYRGFDTLGEEFILFTSVMAVEVLLRKQKDESEEPSPEDREDQEARRQVPRTSEAVRMLGVGLVGLTACFGLYICAHGQVTPGGGFQGGVVLATAPLVVYLSAEAKTFERIAPHVPVRALEAVGAAAYIVIGLAGLVLTGEFLRNVLPLGVPQGVLSGGTMLWINLAVGLEVAAGFVVLLTAFLRETLQLRLRGGR